MDTINDICLSHRPGFRGGSSTKLTTMVDFPVYGLDMSPHLANKLNAANKNEPFSDDENLSSWKKVPKHSNTSDNLYDLYAICYHHGTDLETGHYTAACRNPCNTQWYLYDDSKVTNLTEKKRDLTEVLVNNSAYILFYQRRNHICATPTSNSSAASTSSLISTQEHWVFKMPKFISPKAVIPVVEERFHTKEDIFEERKNHICQDSNKSDRLTEQVS